MVVTSEHDRFVAIERGLAAQCDAESRGFLLINKALLLHARGEVQPAIDLLGGVATDPASTLAAELLAKHALWQLIRSTGHES
jgi:hypothetical protein